MSENHDLNQQDFDVLNSPQTTGKKLKKQRPTSSTRNHFISLGTRSARTSTPVVGVAESAAEFKNESPILQPEQRERRLSLARSHEPGYWQNRAYTDRLRSQSTTNNEDENLMVDEGSNEGDLRVLEDTDVTVNMV